MPQCGLDSPKDQFHDKIIRFAGRFGEREVFLLLGDFNRHAGYCAKDYEDQRRGCGFRVRNMVGEEILEFSPVMNIIWEWSTFFKKGKVFQSLMSFGDQ